MSAAAQNPVATYRDTIGRFATGVAVVTATGPEGPAGMTTNAVASLSLDPVLLLVCFDLQSRTLDIVQQSRAFAVNILGAGDEELAAVFASKRVAREKFDSVTHRETHGVPVLDSALAWIACSLVELRPAGDHMIGIGEVIGMAVQDERSPLVFYRGRYNSITDRG